MLKREGICAVDDRKNGAARCQAYKVRRDIVLDSPNADGWYALLLSQRRGNPPLMVRLQLPQQLDSVGLALIIHHLVVNPAEQDQVRGVIEVVLRQRWVEPRAISLSGDDMALLSHHRFIVRGGGIYDELVPTYRASVSRWSPEVLSR